MWICFQRREPPPIRIKILDHDSHPAAAPDNSFWDRTHNLQTLEADYSERHNAVLSLITPEKDSCICRFCKRCFGRLDLPPNQTWRENRPGGLRGLRAVSKDCPICIFILEVIRAHLGAVPMEDPSTFTIRLRRRHWSLVDIGLEVGDTYHSWKGVMAYCSMNSNLSNRAIWGTKWPINLQSRAPLLREWIQYCQKGHKDCSHVVMGGYPSRLLHIESSNNDLLSVRLVDVDPRSKYKWATLSHRWGTTGSPLRTTRGNIDDFKRSIPVSKLPQTFADAIAVTLAVGLHYLWVDSLCIVQDSVTDWEKESSMMGRIYENAELTIAACSSMDSAGGCHLTLQQQPSLGINPLAQDDLDYDDILSYPGMVRSKVANPFAVNNSPLSERGWVFQEVVLSRRILYFTRDQVYWQCRSAAESEDGTIHILKEHNMNERSPRMFFQPNVVPATDFPGLWWTWAMDYSKRDFTKHADRLYACAGISEFFSHLADSNDIVLGLMREHLQLHLLWQLQGTGRATPRMRTLAKLPSWTWLCRHAPLSVHIIDQAPMAYACDILNVDLIWSGAKLTSPLDKASIDLLGRVISMRVGLSRRMFKDSTELVDSEGWVVFGSTLNKPTATSVVYYSVGMFDDKPPAEGSTILCLEMLRIVRPYPEELGESVEWKTLVTEQKVLILKELDASSHTFERLGVGYIRYDEPGAPETLFDLVNRQIITLV